MPETSPEIGKEQAGREARESVGRQRPAVGENRVQAAMRRYLGASVFEATHPHPKAEEKSPEDEPKA